VISFSYVEPTDLDGVLAALQQHGDEAKLIAGGTGLVNLMKQRLVQPEYVVSLRRVGGLDGISANGELHLGALCTHRAVETSPQVRSFAPLLAETFHHVASIRIRNIATVGGALAHGDPNQDPPAALIALDARVRMRSNQGERELPVEELFAGYYETVLEPDEIVTEVVVPEQPSGSGWAFIKFLPQTQDDYATVAVAARLAFEGERIAGARVALGAAGPTPVRAAAVERALQGQRATSNVFREAAALVTDEVDPTSDFRGSAQYKRDMAVVMVRRALEQAAGRARGAA
jgi:carbon-monoxide dehydrogenase medium subunit